ncbi:Tfp pilus assembly protein FimT/FimU [Candidatus Omnitrophota bacterium]
MRNRLAGFTLIELFIVIIIIGIVAAVAVPNFGKSYSGFLLSNAASDLAYTMRYARAQSIMERTYHKLNFDAEKKSYWITKASNNSGTEFERIGNIFGKVEKMPEAITLDSEVEEIMFYPDGSIDSATLYFHNNNEKYYTILTYGKGGYVQVLDYKK